MAVVGGVPETTEVAVIKLTDSRITAVKLSPGECHKVAKPVAVYISVDILPAKKLCHTCTSSISNDITIIFTKASTVTMGTVLGQYFVHNDI